MRGGGAVVPTGRYPAHRQSGRRHLVAGAEGGRRENEGRVDPGGAVAGNVSEVRHSRD